MLPLYIIVKFKFTISKIPTYVHVTVHLQCQWFTAEMAYNITCDVRYWYMDMESQKGI